ncbi:hypothetical protein [Aeoliella mucimassa]|uniref:Secreted protein n=1 Tax=Aeoliella mucimassa TaxID=2527972 RepID=A0A518AJ23_9BACT|nr:hypothetical protein [Aeoliella mucimassa]QDU54738.1 hypothetical protein Pan181_09210 [Aeoliella mucimassa]
MTIAKLCRPLMVCLLFGVATHASAGNCYKVLVDPGTRHTNGIPMATSEPLRGPSVSWNCNPDRLGYCGGRYYVPCVDSLRPSRVWAAAHGNLTPPQHTYNWNANLMCPPCDQESSFDGIEPAGFSQLGELPNNMMMPGGAGRGSAGAVAPPAGFGP